jgi:hypothetical protein
VTIILGGDSLNKTFFPLKEQDARNLFFFHNSRELIFRAAAMSGATRTISQKLNWNDLINYDLIKNILEIKN